jgi:predicted GNAT family acetyltransferase
MSGSEDATVEVTHEPAQQRWVARIDGDEVGSAYYETTDDRIVFTHTEVDDAHEGRGVGSALARGALDDVRAEGTRRVVARCSFIRGWIDRHPDYADLTQG